MTEQEKAPERIWLDGDTEAGDCPGVRGPFEDPKYVSEPAIEYIRADLARKVKPLSWVSGESPQAEAFGISRFYLVYGFSGNWEARWPEDGGTYVAGPFETQHAAREACQSHYNLVALSALVEVK